MKLFEGIVYYLRWVRRTAWELTYSNFRCKNNYNSDQENIFSMNGILKFAYQKSFLSWYLRVHACALWIVWSSFLEILCVLWLKYDVSFFICYVSWNWGDNTNNIIKEIENHHADIWSCRINILCSILFHRFSPSSVFLQGKN